MASVLSRERERDLIQQAQAGDTRARDELLQSLWPYVCRESHRRARAWPHTEADDLIAEGGLAVLVAIGKFDPSRECRLLTLAMLYIAARHDRWGRLQRSLVSSGWAQRLHPLHLSLDAAMSDRDDGATFGDLIADEETPSPEHAAEVTELHRRMTEGISERDADIVLRWLDGQRFRDAGAEHGVSHETARLVVAHAARRVTDPDLVPRRMLRPRA